MHTYVCAQLLDKMHECGYVCNTYSIIYVADMYTHAHTYTLNHAHTRTRRKRQ